MRFRNLNMLTPEERATLTRWSRWGGAIYGAALVVLMVFAFQQMNKPRVATDPAPQTQSQPAPRAG